MALTESDQHGAQSQLADLFSELGRELATQHSIDETFALITERAVRVVPSAQDAAISRGRRGAFETVASTSDYPLKVDQIQYELNSGPCVDAIVDDNVYRVGDLGSSRDRWEEFGRRAHAEYGLTSLLSVRMFLEGDDLQVGLNLYSQKPDAFDESDQTTAMLLATHGALALTAAQRQTKIDNLERALETSRRIGAAIGVLMVRHKITYEQSFDLLRIASQTGHRKLFAVAEDVIDTGALDVPAVPERRQRH